MSTNTLEQASSDASRSFHRIKLVSHSNLFYWWPVWAVGFIMALITLMDGNRLAIIPESTEVHVAKDGKEYVLNLPQLPSATLTEAEQASGRVTFPIRIAKSKDVGIVWIGVLLLVVFVSNVPLRGLWSAVAILSIVLVSVILSLERFWGPVLDTLGKLNIYISLAGYLVPSLVLFVLWSITIFFFDSRNYIIFAPGQLRVHQTIGEGEQVYDASGTTFRKRRVDLFRHWMLGMGSGDVVVNTSGAQAVHLELPNVLFVGWKLRRVAALMKERPVVAAVGTAKG